MSNLVPWSNFHELNLDWVLLKMKELEAKVNEFTGSAIASNNPPIMDGVAAAGTSVDYARGDHVHPTDTSRASQTDLEAMSENLEEIDRELWAGINGVDDKVKFSTAAPLVDGVANPGSSDAQARADHVHPTDTSRASKSEFDTLKSTVDAWTGAASPYGSLPNMDGEASAGSIDAYSRGDHVHPSDTNKLDTAGGTITGDLEVDGFISNPKTQGYGSVSAIGWLRVAAVPDVKGTQLQINIAKRGSTGTPAENHIVDFYIESNSYGFNTERSQGSIKIIDKIRYTDAGKIDVHLDQNYASYLSVSITPNAPRETERKSIEVLSTFLAVDDAPAGETIKAEYSFTQQGYTSTTPTSPYNLVTSQVNTVPGVGCNFTEAMVELIPAETIPADTVIITGLPEMKFTGVFYQADAGNTHGTRYPVRYGVSNNYPNQTVVVSTTSIASGSDVRLALTYLSK